MSTNMETAIEFANKVRAELSHLTSEQVADLTDGLEADIASSLDDGADIGSAKKYATDLLAAAGMSKDVEVVPNAVDVFINKVTLVKLCEERLIDHVSVLKIDAEGSELDVLLGAKQLLENQKIDFLQFEFGDAAISARVFLTDIVTLLHSFDYTVYKIMPKSLKHIVVGANLNRSYSCSNFIAISAKSSNKLKMYISGL